MVMSYNAGPELGIIEVHTTNEGGHPVDFWAKRCIERIIAVSEDAPENVEKQINDSNGYNEFTSKGFIPEGYTFWGEGSRGITDLAGDKDYGVQNTEAFFSWINEFILNPSTTVITNPNSFLGNLK